jgi:hypothetical protein
MTIQHIVDSHHGCHPHSLDRTRSPDQPQPRRSEAKPHWTLGVLCAPLQVPSPWEADSADAGDCLEIRFVPVSPWSTQMIIADAERVQPVALGGEILTLC